MQSLTIINVITVINGQNLSKIAKMVKNAGPTYRPECLKGAMEEVKRREVGAPPILLVLYNIELKLAKTYKFKIVILNQQATLDAISFVSPLNFQNNLLP